MPAVPLLVGWLLAGLRARRPARAAGPLLVVPAILLMGLQQQYTTSLGRRLPCLYSPCLLSSPPPPLQHRMNGGTNIALAVQKAGQLLKPLGPATHRVLVLLTDGRIDSHQVGGGQAGRQWAGRQIGAAQEELCFPWLPSPLPARPRPVALLPCRLPAPLFPPPARPPCPLLTSASVP